MTALHPASCYCYDCTPGFPALATAVQPDDTRLIPAPRYMAERLKDDARAQRYRKGPSRQRYLASQRRQNELSGLVKS